MRITERMGLVYTALFLTVSVAVITQNSNALMAAFRGETAVVAVDDIFTVQPGQDQRLAILANDVRAQQLPRSAVKIINQPDCGAVERRPGGLVYSKSGKCTGNQSFSYCLATDGKCLPARVILRISANRSIADSITQGSTITPGGLDAQATINAKDLEISNVRLGTSAKSEKTELPATGMKLAKVAIESQSEIVHPTSMARAAALSGTFSMDPTMAFHRSTATGQTVDVAANTAQVSDASDASGTIGITLPSAPEPAPMTFGGPLVGRASLVARLATIDLIPPPMKDRAAFDQSPFGTPCAMKLTSAVLPGAMVKLSLTAPCHPNTRVEILSGKLIFAMMTGHTGNLTVTVPALDRAAQFMLRFADGTKLRVKRTVDAVDNFDRVAIQWSGNVRFNLHAYEFGATKTSSGHVWSGQSRNPGLSREYGGGFAVNLGDTQMKNPMMAQVYSLPVNQVKYPGVVQMSVEVSDMSADCGKSGVLRSHLSEGGRLIGSAGYLYKIPACGTSSGTLVLNNAVRDLIIARK